jgi:hypothetical protein
MQYHENGSIMKLLQKIMLTLKARSEKNGGKSLY